MAFSDANYNHNENRQCFYYNCAVTTAREFASGHLETEAKSVNMDLEPQVATGLDLRNGAGGGYNFPPPAASPTSGDPSGHTPPHDSGSKLCVPQALGCPRPHRPRNPTSHRRPREDGCPSLEQSGLRGGQAVVSGELQRGAPAAGRALGEGSSSPGRHAGRGAVSPGGQRPRSAAFRPPRSWRDDLGHLPPTEKGSESQVGLHFDKGPPTPFRPPPRAAPRPLPDPQTHPLQGTGGPRRPSAVRPQPPAAAQRPPPACPQRPWLRELGSGWIRACGAGPRGSCSEVAAWEALMTLLPPLIRRQPTGHGPGPGGLLNQPGRGARPQPLQIPPRGPNRGLVRP